MDGMSQKNGARRTAGQLHFPQQVWLGKAEGNWPIQVFTTEQAAADWAAKSDREERRYVLPVDIDTNASVYTAHVVPEHRVLVATGQPVPDYIPSPDVEVFEAEDPRPYG